MLTYEECLDPRGDNGELLTGTIVASDTAAGQRGTEESLDPLILSRVLYQYDDITYIGTVEKALVRNSTGAKEYIASFNDSALPFNPFAISWCLLLTEKQVLMARTDYATRTKTQQKEEAE